jgi:hypothetical protein
MKTTRDQLLNMKLNGTLIHESYEGLIIRTSDNAVWDSAFEIIGPACIGTDNDQNRCIIRFQCLGQVEVYINGVLHPAEDVEIRFVGPWEYMANLDWMEALGLKAGEIKRRETSQ